MEMLSAVWDLDLERNERDVLEVMAWHANADGLCWPSKARIMYRTGLSESSVKRALGSLKKTGLITVEAHAEGGRGKTPLYKVCPEKGVKKIPFEEWKKGFSENPINAKGGQGEHEKGVTVTPEYTKEPTSTTPSNEGAASGSSAAAQEDEVVDIGKEKKNWFDVLARRFDEQGIIITPEDRKTLPSNLIRCQIKHKATDQEMYALITHLVDRRRNNVTLSPQRALDDIRGLGPRAGAKSSKCEPSYLAIKEL